MGKSLSDECLECRSKEDVEHVLIHLIHIYRDERMRLNQKISKAGWKKFIGHNRIYIYIVPMNS